MATLSGKQVDLRAVLRKLIEIDSDASSAYRAAIDRLEDPLTKRVFEGFQNDHVRHCRKLRPMLAELGAEPPDEWRIRQVLSKGRLMIGNLAGDRGILRAMQANEEDTNAAYEAALGHTDLTPAQKAVLQQGLDDERRHKNWLEEQLALLEASAESSRVNPGSA